ncbi:MAG: DUF3263 domain-containing protein [Microbacteriaceae bacterium]
MAAQPEPQHPAFSALPQLSDRDAAVLDFERQWWRHAGAKEEAIRDVFGLSAARYYQVLNAVIDSPAAVRHDPMLVKRLHRARDARTEARAARTFTTPAAPSEAEDARLADPTD